MAITSGILTPIRTIKLRHILSDIVVSISDTALEKEEAS